MDLHRLSTQAGKIVLPLVLGGAILYWMYRDFDFGEVRQVLLHEMDWTWMLLSMPFGITAQLFRGLRWRQTLSPLGEEARLSTSVNAVFLSHASSLVIPRVGEFARCGVLKRYDGVTFAKALGTVVTERAVDSIVVMVITVVTLLLQLPTFHNFFVTTGTRLDTFLGQFTTTGYIVTAICLVITLLFLWLLMKRFTFMAKVKDMVNKVKEGILSLKGVEHKGLFTFYTLAIWGSYFLHYWITFLCFDFTSHLTFTVAIVSFIVGSISVIVPTPNGAGPWHFAVKTILILYGLADTDAVTFVLIVHTVQTALVPLLGIFSWVALALRPASSKHQTFNI